MRLPLSLSNEQAINTLDEPFRSQAVRLIGMVQHIIQDMPDIFLTVEDGRRSFEAQFEAYKTGRKQDATGKWVLDLPKRITTKAAPGFSAHQYNRAIHLVFRNMEVAKGGFHHWLADDDPRWRTIIGDIAEELGLSWGGRISGLYDASHIEDPDWKKLGKALAWQGIPDDVHYHGWKEGNKV